MKLESDQSGTTLVEAVITMFIISVLLLVASTLTIASWRLYTRTQQRTQAIAQAESILTVITADLRSADGWLRMCESDLQNPDTVFTKDGQTSGSAIWLTTGTGNGCCWMPAHFLPPSQRTAHWKRHLAERYTGVISLRTRPPHRPAAFGRKAANIRRTVVPGWGIAASLLHCTLLFPRARRPRGGNTGAGRGCICYTTG